MTARGDATDGRVRRAVWVGLVVLAIVAIGELTAYGLLDGNWIEDDAFVFFRYADNFLHGYGLTWNPGGPRVEGYTSFLYTLLLVVLRPDASDPIPVAQGLNAVLFAGTIAAACLFGRATSGERGLAPGSPAFWLPAALVATSSSMAGWVRNGMETSLFAFLLTVTVAVELARPRRRAALFGSGVLFGLTVLARPEGALLYGAATVLRLEANRRAGRPLVGAPEGWILAGLAAVVVPQVGWRVVYYGAWLPLTFQAKVGLGAALLGRGARGLLAYLQSFSGVLVLAALAAWATAPRRRSVALLVLLIVAWIVFLLAIGMSHWETYYYTMPVHLFSLLLLGRSLAASWGRLRARGGGPILLRVACLVGLVLLGVRNLAPAIQYDRAIGRGLTLSLTDPMRAGRLSGYIAFGRYLKRIAKPGETVAVGPCGAIPYYSGLVTYDTLGLNDPHIAASPGDSVSGEFGHDKGDGAYILGLRPTYLVALATPTERPSGATAGFEKTFREIYADPRFWSLYELRSVRLHDGLFAGRYLNYWRLRDSR